MARVVQEPDGPGGAGVSSSINGTATFARAGGGCSVQWVMGRWWLWWGWSRRRALVVAAVSGTANTVVVVEAALPTLYNSAGSGIVIIRYAV